MHDCPAVRRMQADVEGLLAYRGKDAHRYYLAPIDRCYELVGLVRMRWRGISGGSELWQEVDAFFERLDRTARPSREDARA